MILQGFKLKNINRRTEKHHLKNEGNVSVNTNLVQSVLVFVDESFSDVDLDTLSKILSIKTENIQKITFCSGKNNDEIENAISAKDFGLFGKCKKNLEQIKLSKEIDLIINYTQNNSYVNNLIAQSNANFSVGVRNEYSKIYDLVIDVEKNELELFNVELEKYLKILKKI